MYTIPSIPEAILCTRIMHAVSKIRISQSALLFHARARGRRVAQLEPPAGKPKFEHTPVSWAVKSRHKAKGPTLDLAADFNRPNLPPPVLRASRAPPKRDLGA